MLKTCIWSKTAFLSSPSSSALILRGPHIHTVMAETAFILVVKTLLRRKCVSDKTYVTPYFQISSFSVSLSFNFFFFLWKKM